MHLQIIEEILYNYYSKYVVDIILGSGGKRGPVKTVLTGGDAD